jgi:tryptophan-rich sensory protein
MGDGHLRRWARRRGPPGGRRGLSDVGDWCKTLQKPSFTPPNWAFAPAWTIILAAAATTGVLAFRADLRPSARAKVLRAFGVNGALHLVWSALFFRWRRPDLALIEMILFWLSIIVLMVVTARAGAIGPALLAPYIFWVSFALLVNAAVVRLNFPVKTKAAEP